MGQKGWDDLAAGDQTPVDRCEGYVWGRSRAEGVSKVGVLITLTHDSLSQGFSLLVGCQPRDLAFFLNEAPFGCIVPRSTQCPYCPEGTGNLALSRSVKLTRQHRETKHLSSALIPGVLTPAGPGPGPGPGLGPGPVQGSL